MSFTNTPGYSWSSGEVVTATKLNSTATPTIADGQGYTFAAGAAATPSINFTTATTTGLYLGTTAIGFSVAAASVGTWSAASIFSAGLSPTSGSSISFFKSDGSTSLGTLSGSGLTVALPDSATALIRTSRTLTNQSGVLTPTLGTTSPVTGAPTKWIAIVDNGTTRYFPTWS